MTQPAIPTLTPEYDRYRRYLVLTSGFLLVWEVTGISVLNLGYVELANPDSPPAILSCIVLYLSYKVLVEWSQCDVRRRFMFTNRLDIWVSLFLGIAAVFIYVTGFVEYFTRTPRLFLAATALSIGTLVALRTVSKHRSHRDALTIVPLRVGAGLLLIVYSFVLEPRLGPLQIALVVTFGLAGWGLTRHSLAAVLMKATRLTRRIRGFDHDGYTDDELAKLTASNAWRFYFNPNFPEQSKVLEFAGDGSISKGGNINEHSWEVKDCKLTVFDVDGRVHSRFSFRYNGLLFLHTGDRGMRSIARQYLIMEHPIDHVTASSEGGNVQPRPSALHLPSGWMHPS